MKRNLMFLVVVILSALIFSSLVFSQEEDRIIGQPRPGRICPQNCTIGVGLSWGQEEIFVSDLHETCLRYVIYNPFDVNATANLTTGTSIKKLVIRIEPETVFVPAGIMPENSEKIEICFKDSRFRFPLPFYPKTYKGKVLAKYMGQQQEMGSSVGTSVGAPLIIHVGSMRTFYLYFVGPVIILLVIFAFLLIKVKKKRKKSIEK